MTAFMPTSSLNSIFSPDAYEPSPSFPSSSFFSFASSSSPYHSSPSTTTSGEQATDFSAFFPSISSIAEQLRAASAPIDSSSSSSSSPSAASTSAFSLPLPSAERASTQEEIDFLAAFGSRPLDEADELFLDSGYTVNDLPLPYVSPSSPPTVGPMTVPFDSLGSEYDLFAPDLLKSDSSASHATSSVTRFESEDDFNFFSSSELLGGSLETYDPFSLGIMIQEGSVEEQPSWLRDLVGEKEDEEACGIQGWSEEEETDAVQIVVQSEEDGDGCLLEGWSGEEAYVPPTEPHLPCSSHASTSTNDTYLLPLSPPPVISSLKPPRVAHRSRSIPSLSTSQSPSSTSAYRHKLLPAKPSLPVLRERFRPIKEEQIDEDDEDFSAQFANVGGYGGHGLGMGKEWEARTTGSELYGGYQTTPDISRRFTSDYPYSRVQSKFPPSTPAYYDPSQFAQPPPLHVYTVQTTARLQAYSPVPPSPPPFLASPLTFSPTVIPSCIEPAPVPSSLPSRRSAALVQEDKDASTSRRSQSLTSPPPTPVLLSAPTAQCPPPPKRPSKSPARAHHSVPAGIVAAGSIVAAHKANDDVKRATIKAESMVRKRSFDAIAANTLSSSSSSRRTNATLPPSPPPSSSPAETKRRPAARRPAPPPPSISNGLSSTPCGGNQRVWGFVNYTFADAHELLTGVAATGPKLGSAGKRRRDDDDEAEDEKPVGKKGKKGRH